jgi:hypothetical protein
MKSRCKHGITGKTKNPADGSVERPEFNHEKGGIGPVFSKAP